MSADERVAAVLAEHTIVYENDGGDYGGRSWFECSCDHDNVISATGYATEDDHRAHVAAALGPVLAEVRAEAWEVGRTDGHRELRPINAFGDTEAARNPYQGGTP